MEKERKGNRGIQKRGGGRSGLEVDLSVLVFISPTDWHHFESTEIDTAFTQAAPEI